MIYLLNMNPAMIIIFFAQIFHLAGLDFIAAIFLSVICIISSTSGVTKPRSRREYYLLVQRIRSLCLDHLCIMCFISRVTPGVECKYVKVRLMGMDLFWKFAKMISIPSNNRRPHRQFVFNPRLHNWPRRQVTRYKWVQWCEEAVQGAPTPFQSYCGGVLWGIVGGYCKAYWADTSPRHLSNTGEHVSGSTAVLLGRLLKEHQIFLWR